MDFAAQGPRLLIGKVEFRSWSATVMFEIFPEPVWRPLLPSRGKSCCARPVHTHVHIGRWDRYRHSHLGREELKVIRFRLSLGTELGMERREREGVG